VSILQLRLRGFKHISTVALEVPELDTEKARFDLTIRLDSSGAQNEETIDGQRNWNIMNETRQRDNMSDTSLTECAG
jgi:hypothetical protein